MIKLKSNGTFATHKKSTACSICYVFSRIRKKRKKKWRLAATFFMFAFFRCWALLTISCVWCVCLANGMFAHVHPCERMGLCGKRICIMNYYYYIVGDRVELSQVTANTFSRFDRTQFLRLWRCAGCCCFWSGQSFMLMKTGNMIYKISVGLTSLSRVRGKKPRETWCIFFLSDSYMLRLPAIWRSGDGLMRWQKYAVKYLRIYTVLGNATRSKHSPWRRVAMLAEMHSDTFRTENVDGRFGVRKAKRNKLLIIIWLSCEATSHWARTKRSPQKRREKIGTCQCNK